MTLSNSSLRFGLKATCTAACGLVLVLALAASASAAEWGTLKGQFIYDGKAPEPGPLDIDKDPEVCGKKKLLDESLIVSKNGGLKNAIIWLRTEKVDVAPEYAKTADEKVTLDNNSCQFVPHIAVLRTGQTLVIKNSDPVGHNSKVSSMKNSEINPIIAAHADVEQKYTKEENLPIPVVCNIHKWMKAYLIIRSNPYVAVADANGNFEIKDLPADKELEFQLWQESAGNLKNAKDKDVKIDSKGRFKIKLKPGMNNIGEIKVPASLFKK